MESPITYTNEHTNTPTHQHKYKLIDGFTKKYNVNKLVYYEHTEDVFSAITREKQLKGWIRKKKNDLVISVNPHWNDLAIELGLYQS